MCIYIYVHYISILSLFSSFACVRRSRTVYKRSSTGLPRLHTVGTSGPRAALARVAALPLQQHLFSFSPPSFARPPRPPKRATKRARYLRYPLGRLRYSRYLGSPRSSGARVAALPLQRHLFNFSPPSRARRPRVEQPGVE